MTEMSCKNSQPITWLLEGWDVLTNDIEIMLLFVMLRFAYLLSEVPFNCLNKRTLYCMIVSLLLGQTSKALLIRATSVLQRRKHRQSSELASVFLLLGLYIGNDIPNGAIVNIYWAKTRIWVYNNCIGYKYTHWLPWMQFSDSREFNNDCSTILQGVGANVKIKGRNTNKITLKWRWARVNVWAANWKGLAINLQLKGK